MFHDRANQKYSPGHMRPTGRKLSIAAIDTQGDLEMPFVLKRTQIQVRLSFTMTINKSHGQSFQNLGVCVTSKETIFTLGQLHVALSRCRRNDEIKIQYNLEEKMIRNAVFEQRR
ncbi:hypothetical protein TNCV_1414431 [Trichonephila clavipes]|nr:hypothetical protein TNCV_1414431 [Trichonephila clavipes]